MDRFLSISWSDGISDDESNLLIEEVSQLVKWLYFMLPTALNTPPTQIRVFGDWTLPDLDPTTPYWGAQWYVETSYNEDLQQVIAPLFLELVRREPWQLESPHWDIALIEEDITDYPITGATGNEEEHYALGASLPNSATVMSVHRVRTISDTGLRKRALRRLIQHNLGHILGAASYKRDVQSVKHGLEVHCANPCVMRHAGSIEELITYSQEESLEMSFCEQCQQEMLSSLLFHTKNWS